MSMSTVANLIAELFCRSPSDEYLKTEICRSKMKNRFRLHKNNPNKLDLSELKLKQITPEMIRLINPDVTTIDLSDNFLEALPVELFKFTKLKLLILIGNQLTDLPVDIAKLKELKYLSLDSHLFDKVPNEIKESLEWQEWWFQSDDYDFIVRLKHIVDSENHFAKLYEVSILKFSWDTVENTAIYNNKFNGEMLMDNYDKALSFCSQLIQKNDVSKEILEQLGVDYEYL